MTYTAIGIFQGDADWNVSVRVAGFLTQAVAERYAGSFHIRLMNGRLYRDHVDSATPGNNSWIEVMDSDVSVARLKSVVRQRVIQAHNAYKKQGLTNSAVAILSIKAFKETGTNILVTSDNDYEPIPLPIERWHLEAGLNCGFGSLAYSVEPDNCVIQRSETPRCANRVKPGASNAGKCRHKELR